MILAAIAVSRINPAFRCDSSCLDVQWVNIKKDKVSMYIFGVMFVSVI